MAKFRLQRLRGGRKHVLTTDSAADYLRCLIDEMAGNFNVLCHVTVTELAAVAAAPGAPGGGGVGGTPQAQWMRVEVASAPEASLLDRASEFRFGEFADELNHVFLKFYDREQSPSPIATDPVSRAWTVRHRRDCPWI